MGKDKVWFITGTSSGFGRAIAEEVIRRGQRVVASARNPRTLDELVALAPERVLAVQLDVTNPDGFAAALQAARDRFGAIDVLVNNAGFSIVGAFEETNQTELRLVFETMFFGPAALTRALLPEWRERKTGTVIQITSLGGLVTAPGFGPYCAAKHALEALSEALAAEVAPHGIRVLIVEPGAFRTSLFGSGFRNMPALDAYAETVGATRQYVEREAGAQAGDPVKAAKAIVDAVEVPTSRLRLPLGADAVDRIRDKLAQVSADIDAGEALARATAFDH